MTDNEIIKALELCANFTIESCRNCPCNIGNIPCEKMRKDALDLINRQKAEIERLKSTTQVVNQIHVHIDEQFRKECEHEIKISKSEAIKEFSEKLLYEIKGIPPYHFSFLMVAQSINKITKEMAEVNK